VKVNRNIEPRPPNAAGKRDVVSDPRDARSLGNDDQFSEMGVCGDYRGGGGLDDL
jgi:hypothetical protein